MDTFCDVLHETKQKKRQTNRVVQKSSLIYFMNNKSIWVFFILTLEPGSNLGFFLSLDADLFFFFFFDEWSLDFVLSGFNEALLLVDEVWWRSGLAVTFSWLLPTLRTSLIGFSAFSDLSSFSNGYEYDFVS